MTERYQLSRKEEPICVKVQVDLEVVDGYTGKVEVLSPFPVEKPSLPHWLWHLVFPT